MKYFTSDLHFAHKNICKYTDRNRVTNEAKHTEWIIDLCNERMKNGDLLYILGDVSFDKVDNTVKYLNAINGQKIVIKGNHDRREDLDKLVQMQVIQSWYEYKEIKIQDQTACLFHFPIASWHKQNYGSFMLHGHSHGGYASEGRILDVGIDSMYNLFDKHFIVSETEIYDYLINTEIYVADDHRKIMKD